MEWSSFFKNDRTLAKTKLGDILISTVFLGINHSFGNGPHYYLKLWFLVLLKKRHVNDIPHGTRPRPGTGPALVEKIRTRKNIPPVKLLSRFEMLKMPR